MRTSVRAWRIVAAVAATAVLAGCTASGPGPVVSPTATSTAPTPSPTPTESSSAPSPADSPPPEPTPVVAVTSTGGTLSAEVPATWRPCDDPASYVAGAPLDVLGAWAIQGACDAGRALAVASYASPDPSLDAQGYYDTFFAPAAAEGTTITSDILAGADGLEVLVVHAQDAAGSQLSFTVLAGDVVVIGRVEGDGTVSTEELETMRSVATTVRVVGS